MTQRAVFSAFSAWASTTAELRRQRAIVKRAAAKIARNALASSFYDWQRKWCGKAEWEAKVALSGRFLAAIKSQTLSSAFAGWRDTHRKAPHGRGEGREVHPAHDAECGGAGVHRLGREGRGRSAKRTSKRSAIASSGEAKLQRTERFILAWKNRSLSDAFVQWSANTRVLTAERRVVQRTVNRMTSRRMFAAFNAWASIATEMRRQRVVVRRCVARMSRRHLAAGFFEWRRRVADDKALAEAEQARWRVDVLKTERFVRAWLNLRLSAAFSRWSQVTVDLRSLRRRPSPCACPG